MSESISDKRLIHFVCKPCGYQESIGVGFHLGIVIKGDLTFVCPRCGEIVLIEGIRIISPVRPVGPG